MLKVDTVRVGGSGCPPARDMRVVCIGLVCCPCCKSADSALLDDVLRNPQLIVRGVCRVKCCRHIGVQRAVHGCPPEFPGQATCPHPPQFSHIPQGV